MSIVVCLCNAESEYGTKGLASSLLSLSDSSLRNSQRVVYLKECNLETSILLNIEYNAKLYESTMIRLVNVKLQEILRIHSGSQNVKDGWCVKKDDYTLIVENPHSHDNLPTITVWGVYQEGQVLILRTDSSSHTHHYPISLKTSFSVQTKVQQRSSCPPFSVATILRFNMKTDITDCSFKLFYKQSDRVVISSSTSPFTYGMNSFSICLDSSDYTLTLSKSDTSGWLGNYVEVILPDGSVLLRDTVDVGQKTRSLCLNFAYQIHPFYHSWHYNMEGRTPPSTWTTSDEVTKSWPVSEPSFFPLWSEITQYYASSFTVESLSSFSFLRITCVAYAGAVVYLNGQEIGRVNMPLGEITSQTSPLREFSHPTLLTFTVSVHETFVLLTNHLAVELHATQQSEQSTSFDGSVLFLFGDNLYNVAIDGSSNLEDDPHNISSLFDMNPTTVFSHKQCKETIIYWKYSTRREIINHYAFVPSSTCPKQFPSSWVVEGSNNGISWTRVHHKDHVQVDQIKRLDFKFFSTRAFSSYRFRILDCEFAENQLCNNNALHIADILLYSDYVKPDCFDDYFPPAIVGDYAYMPCPDYSSGYQGYYCSSSGFINYTYECTPFKPAIIIYPSSYMVFPVNTQIEPQVPLIEACCYSAEVYPSLPKGLAIDSNTGTISGIPTSPSKRSRYTVSVHNSAGSSDVEIEIELQRSGSSSLLSILIVVVITAVIICVIVFLLRVYRSRKRVRKVLSQ